MLTKAKLLGMAATAAALVAVLAASHMFAMRLGAAQERTIHQAAVIEYQKRIRETQAKLEEATRARRQVVTETIEVIRHVPDPTGCTTTRIPDDILSRVRPAGDDGPR
jgi:uncharacterized membrane protein (DUF106 family)